jgi:signal transduction histidine kinase
MSIEKRILVIDDEERMADSIRALLSNYDYLVEVAYGGKEGIEKLSTKSYHLVVTDLRMPGVTGYDVLRFLREKQPHVAPIVITGHASTESAIEAIHYRAFDYLQKPFEFEKLKECVDRAFNKIEADHMREDMISMITHDIKIPLSSIAGFSAMIFDDTGEPRPRAPEYVRLIRVNAQKIQALIDNFLTTCKIEAGKLQLFRQKLNLQDVIDDLLAIMRMDMERQGQRVEAEFDLKHPFVEGDEHLLSRALGNILSNAIKYTPQGGVIRVETSKESAVSSPLKKDSVKVVIRNTGPGIDPDHLDSIFEKYKRSDNIRGIEGSGIGLYVVKFVVDHHGGHVTLESAPNEWTACVMTLPLSEPPTP